MRFLALLAVMVNGAMGLALSLPTIDAADVGRVILVNTAGLLVWWADRELR